jgi:osmotically-inducible protein OsmY
MVSPTQLQRNVLAELDWDPTVNAAKVGITVDDGVVTLKGTVDSYADKLAAEKAAKRVHGVKAVANDLDVKLLYDSKRSDTDIAHAALRALEWDTRIPHEALKVTVKNAWVTLDGQVEWQFQRDDAGRTIRRLTGVIGVSNLITVKPHILPGDIKDKIVAALERKAQLDAQHVKVQVDGSKITLTGTVRSWAERQDAEQAAWSAPGVADVANHLRVEYEALTAV